MSLVLPLLLIAAGATTFALDDQLDGWGKFLAGLLLGLAIWAYWRERRLKRELERARKKR